MYQFSTVHEYGAVIKKKLTYVGTAGPDYARGGQHPISTPPYPVNTQQCV